MNIELNGTQYTLSKLTCGDLVKLREYVQWLPYIEFKKQKDLFEEREYSEELAQIRSECARKRLREFDDEVIACLQTVDGILKVLELCITKKHPDITLQWLTDTCDVEWIKNNAADIFLSTGLHFEDEQPETTSKKKGHKSPSA